MFKLKIGFLNIILCYIKIRFVSKYINNNMLLTINNEFYR